MTANEFNKVALRTEETTRITFDVTPFGDRQAEAIDFYLHEVGTQIQYGVFGTTRPIYIRHSRGLQFLPTTMTWLSNVWAKGVPMNLEEAST